jgi:hypothetical protein
LKWYWLGCNSRPWFQKFNHTALNSGEFPAELEPSIGKPVATPGWIGLRFS